MGRRPPKTRVIGLSSRSVVPTGTRHWPGSAQTAAPITSSVVHTSRARQRDLAQLGLEEDPKALRAVGRVEQEMGEAGIVG
jgi:hypothetical protein